MTTGVEGLCALGTAAAVAQDIAGAVDAITATASATQATATVVSNYITRYGTVAAGSGAGLPYARTGSSFVLANGSGVNAMTVFGQGSDTVNGIAGATGFTLPAGKTAIFIAPAAGKWVAILSA